MGSNAFGTLFRITTWGESHGKEIGVVIDGCPPGVAINEREVQRALDARRPGTGAHVSPRKERDRVEIVSGVFDGVSTGAPIAMRIANCDIDSSSYERAKDVIRPGHANYTWKEKYGLFDYRGGGRASARETAARVAAGAVAGLFLDQQNISVKGWLDQVGGARGEAMYRLIEEVVEAGDSIGGIVGLETSQLPVGLGDPVYEKLEAKLASAMLSIPASKGIEFGEGFGGVLMRGSQHNDTFKYEEGIQLQSNHAGGIQGGVSNGMPVTLRVAFKPASSIKIPQNSVTFEGEEREIAMKRGGRHDPCVAVRAVPVVEAMAKIVLADCVLMQKSVCNISPQVVSQGV